MAEGTTYGAVDSSEGPSMITIVGPGDQLLYTWKLSQKKCFTNNTCLALRGKSFAIPQCTLDLLANKKVLVLKFCEND